MKITKKELDIFGDFISKNCIVKSHLIVTRENLYRRFFEWWRLNISLDVPKKKTFDTWMDQSGYNRIRKFERGPFVYQGLDISIRR